MLNVIPATGPQDRASQGLVQRLREVTIPGVVAGTGGTVLVGGATANSIDSTADLAGRIPYVIVGVVMLSMLLLLTSCRSVAVGPVN